MLVGPGRGDAVGNLLVQAIALGELGSLAEAREVVRASFAPDVYEPSPTAAWLEATERFEQLRDATGARGGVGVTDTAAAHAARGRARRAIAGTTRAAGLSALDALAYRSNLLGADRSLANEGGGNTSAKGTTSTTPAASMRTLWVKGSGTDLATITPSGFAALRLDEVLPLRERDEMDDAEMVDYLVAARSRPTSRGRRSRRCCTRSCRRRTSTTRTPTRSSR